MNYNREIEKLSRDAIDIPLDILIHRIDTIALLYNVEREKVWDELTGVLFPE